MREYYDRWDAFSAGLSWKGRLKEGIRREAIHWADRRLLTTGVRRLYVQSATIQARLARWGGIRSDVLYPPPPPRPYRCEEYGDYLFAVSRLAPLKRFSLLIEALAAPEAAGISCLIAGEGEEQPALRRAIERHGLANRVRLLGRIDEHQLLEHLARCRAVCFVPLDEDYGFVTAEAFASRKAVITCTDSGGPAELVTDSVTGRVCAPDARAIARALREIMDDVGAARRLGEAAGARAATMTWDEALSKLVLV
jgi:glycosyltransferase involved in cell wall biosynthesis